jgi:urease accessory protein
VLLLVHLLAGVLAGVLAAALAHQAGFSAGVVAGCYVLVGIAALGIGVAIDRRVERIREGWTEPRAPEPGERRRAAVLFLLVSLLAVAGLLLASALGLLPERTTERPPFLAGLLGPVLGLDHVLALLWLGLWVGRVRGPALGALPAAFLAGTVAGFGLALGPPVGPVLAALVHLLLVASLLLLVGAALVPVRLPLPEVACLVALMGGCHGYVHGLEIGGAPALWFGLGVLFTAAALIAVGVGMGRWVARPA